MILLLALACGPKVPSGPPLSFADAALSGEDDCAIWDDPMLRARLNRVTDTQEHEGNRVTLTGQSAVGSTQWSMTTPSSGAWLASAGEPGPSPAGIQPAGMLPKTRRGGWLG